MDDLTHHEPEVRPEYAETVAFFGHIAYLVPGLRAVLAAHLRDSDGEMLPHLLMTDVLEWMVSELAQGATVHTPMLFAALERGYVDGSPALRDLMAITFLEHIPGFAGVVPDPTNVGGRFRAGLGPTLGAALWQMEAWRADPQTRPRPAR
jgi:hypothetical protein